MHAAAKQGAIENGSANGKAARFGRVFDCFDDFIRMAQRSDPFAPIIQTGSFIGRSG